MDETFQKLIMKYFDIYCDKLFCVNQRSKSQFLMTKNAQSAPICLVVQFYWDKQQNLFRNNFIHSWFNVFLCFVFGKRGSAKKIIFYVTSPVLGIIGFQNLKHRFFGVSLLSFKHCSKLDQCKTMFEQYLESVEDSFVVEACFWFKSYVVWLMM